MSAQYILCDYSLHTCAKHLSAHAASTNNNKARRSASTVLLLTKAGMHVLDREGVRANTRDEVLKIAFGLLRYRMSDEGEGADIATNL